MTETGNKPVLSIVVAVYNVAPYLRDCLSSVAAQKRQDLEIWVIDDGSKDESPGLCDEWAKKDPRMHVIHQENKGVSEARNLGLAKAAGDWILFVDGDDLLTGDISERLRFESYGEADVVFFGYQELMPNGTAFPVKIQGTPGLLGEQVSRGLPHALLCGSLKKTIPGFPQGINISAPWGKLYRREFLLERKVRFYPGLKRGQDLLFNLHVDLQSPRCALEPVQGYVYRRNPDSISNKYNPSITEAYALLVRQAREAALARGEEALAREYRSFAVECFLFCCQIDFAHRENPLPRREKKARFLQWRDSNDYAEAFSGYQRSAFPRLGRRGRAAAFFCEKKLYGLYVLNYRLYQGLESMKTRLAGRKAG